MKYYVRWEQHSYIIIDSYLRKIQLQYLKIIKINYGKFVYAGWLIRIPKEVMHEAPTTLLHSIEGMPGLDWSRLLKLQAMDGSFLFSPSSTAYALMQTGNDKSLQYLQRAVDKFNGGGDKKNLDQIFNSANWKLDQSFVNFFFCAVPNVYPVDLFEHIWVVDRLQRLGISRYFEPEIRQCMEYVHRYLLLLLLPFFLCIYKLNKFYLHTKVYLVKFQVLDREWNLLGKEF